MRHIAAAVTDAADTRVYECLLPNGVSTAKLAERLAELTKFPKIGPDNRPIRYALLLKGGEDIDCESKLAELRLPEHPVFRLVPEFTAGQDTLDLSFEERSPDGNQSTEFADVRILNESTLIEDIGLDLRPDIRLDANVHKEIETFASRDPMTECAGLLLGNTYVEGRRRIIHVRAFAPALEAEGSRTSVRIGLKAWKSIFALRDIQYCDLDVCGWFHSHAGWGVFMSEPDVFIHKHFFSHPNMVAYVVDPSAGKDGFFRWHEGKISMCPSFGLVSIGPADQTRKSKRARRGPWKTFIGLLLVGLVCFGAMRWHVQNAIVPALQPKPANSREKQSTKPVESVEIGNRVHTLKKGDTLWSVCRQFYGDARLSEALAEYNEIDDVKVVAIGQEILIPPQDELEK